MNYQNHQIMFMFILFTLTTTTVHGYTIETDDQLTVGQINTIKILGLTDGTYYIVTYSYTNTLTNYTFQASGYSYSYKLILTERESTELTINVYEYSTTTLVNSSALLISHLVVVESISDYDFTETLLDQLVWLIPLLIIAAFVTFIVRRLKSW